MRLLRNEEFDRMIIMMTLAHLLVDGVCGAVLASYALKEANYEPIVYYFSLYTFLAFGLQGAVGYLLDKKPTWAKGALLLSALLLMLGSWYQLNIQAQVVLIGFGNCLFHVVVGRYVLLQYKGYGALGTFVASGAIGLGLGLNSLVGAEIFFAGNLLVTLIMLRQIKEYKRLAFESEVKASPKGLETLGIVALLFSCILLRGFSSSSLELENIMLLPCIMALGKFAGGICCDWLGYRKTVLSIFLGGFVALQLESVVGLLLFIFICNMTMPLTLRMAHWCCPIYPGLIFGLAASCLVPGTIFKGYIQLVPQLILVLQFLALGYSGYLLLERKVK